MLDPADFTVKIPSEPAMLSPQEEALHAVSDLIADAGPAPEGIVNAYGEDLLVQTDHGFQMDASRLWVQVEGTAEIDSYRLEESGFHLSISTEMAMRWVRTLDMVLAVLWDVGGDVGWYALPTKQVDPVECVGSGEEDVTIYFDEDDVLTKEAVDSLVWRSRLEHYRLLVLSARDAQVAREEEEAKSRKKKKRHVHERVLFAMDFTDLLKITERHLEPGNMKYRIRDEVWEELEEILEGTPETDKGREFLKRKIASEVVRRRWRMIEPDIDLPSALVEEGAEVIVHPMKRVEEEHSDQELMRLSQLGRRRT
jgi:hypothetical protein